MSGDRKVFHHFAIFDLGSTTRSLIDHMVVCKLTADETILVVFTRRRNEDPQHYLDVPTHGMMKDFGDLLEMDNEAPTKNLDLKRTTSGLLDYKQVVFEVDLNDLLLRQFCSDDFIQQFESQDIVTTEKVWMEELVPDLKKKVIKMELVGRLHADEGIPVLTVAFVQPHAWYTFLFCNHENKLMWDDVASSTEKTPPVIGFDMSGTSVGDTPRRDWNHLGHVFQPVTTGVATRP